MASRQGFAESAPVSVSACWALVEAELEGAARRVKSERPNTPREHARTFR